jgi:hypothetical protein
MNRTSVALLLAALAAAPAAGQRDAPPSAASPAGPRDPASRLAAQREAMRALSYMDGVWRGPATTPEQPEPIVQTERIGPLLDGTVKVIEGRGYDRAGRTVFNALGIISYDPIRRAFMMHSYAMGFAGDFPLELRPDGYVWSRPLGPESTIRYTARVADGEWHEVGDRIVEGAPPQRIFEMRLRRVGPSQWPGAGAVPPR